MVSQLDNLDIWTKILGRPLPSRVNVGGGGHRVSSKKGHTREDMAAARERQQQRLMVTARASETLDKARDRNVRERNVNSGNGAVSIQQQLAAVKQSQAEKERQKELEEKKRKQRQLYLRKKAEEEQREEERRKDEELGPGWRYRQDPNIANAVNSMNPQAGSGGGYKPHSCTKKGG
eukprot:scaffold38517_cov74-Cyclotella_meneghiniana.AAC.2